MNLIKTLLNWLLIIALSIVIAVPIIFIFDALISYIHVHFFHGTVRNPGDDQIDYDDMVFGIIETIVLIVSIWPISIWVSHKTIKRKFLKNQHN